jgi:hypothetical protein
MVRIPPPTGNANAKTENGIDEKSEVVALSHDSS